MSIIIPVKDEKRLLLNCIKQLESFDSDLISEIIIIENGSQHFKNYNFLNPKVRYSHLPVGNRSLARNHGANLATSEIISFLDADTEIEPGWIQEVLKNFDDTTLALTGPIVPSSHSKDLLLPLRTFRSSDKTHNTFISVIKLSPKRIVLNSAAFAIKKTIFCQLGGFDGELLRHEDLDFTQRLLRIEGVIKIIKSPSVRVYFSGGVLKYVLREFDQSCTLIRYHEKWTSSSWNSSLKALLRNIRSWYSNREKYFSNNDVERVEYLMSLVCFVGNFQGLILRLFSPYKGEKQNPKQVIKARFLFIES